MELVQRAPEPTIAAKLGSLAINRLYGRQDLGDICGFASGIATDSVYCADDYVCAENAFHNVRGCCTQPLSFCVLPTQCVNNADLSKSCNGACSDDLLTLKCFDTLVPYCMTWTWPLGPGTTQSQFKCTDSAGLVVNHLSLATTLPLGQSGLVKGVTGLYVQPNAAASTTSAAAVTSSTTLAAAIGGDTAATTSSSLPTASLGTSNGSPSGGPNSNNAVQPSNAGSALSTGATVAIAVVVTVVGLACLGLVAFCIWWRRRKRAHRAALDAAQNASNNRMSYVPSSTYYPPTTAGQTNATQQSAYMGPAPGPAAAPMGQHGSSYDPHSTWHTYNNQAIPPVSGQAAAGAGGYYGAYDPSGQKDGPSQWSAVDDDRLARMRRFSGEGTVVTNDQTVGARTDDGFRPQGA